MIETFRNIFRIPELRKRIFYTLGLLIIYRIGGHIPTPGIDTVALSEFFKESQNTLFGMYDMFVGGAFERATIFALGIMPYISASIIIQLLGTIYEPIRQLQREGQEGRAKITQYTRYGTVLLSIVQALGISVFLQSVRTSAGESVVLPHLSGIWFKVLTVITMTSGTIFIMWLGEQITNRGIGNGISLIIFIGIVAEIPTAVLREFSALQSHTRSIYAEFFILAIIFAMTAFIVWMTQAQRKIPIQTPKKIVGRKVYGGQASYLPLKVNTAGVIPVIFASSIMMVPSTLLSFFPNNDLMQSAANQMAPGSVLYSLFYGLLIVFFTYFYTAIVFNPVDIADNLKKSGGFIPGIRPGQKTSEFLDNVLTRITLPGACFLAFISVVPFLMMGSMNVQFYFGGTSVLIVIGVALDTIQQLESHLMMRHYDGFLKKGRIRGRR